MKNLILCLTVLTVFYPHGSAAFFECEESPTDDIYVVQDWHNCEGIYSSLDGYRYEGQWMDGAQEGKGTFTFSAPHQHAGQKYIGDMKKGLRHGFGTNSFSMPHQHAGEKYIGEWKNDLPDGRGTQILTPPNSNAGYKYVGDFKQGKKTGKGLLTNSPPRYNAGSSYYGTWLDNKPHGSGTAKFYKPHKNAGLEVVHSNWDSRFSDDHPGGMGNCKHTFSPPHRYAGSTYIGECGGKLKTWHGTGIYKFSDKRTYEGQFKDGKFHGSGKLTNVDGSIFVGFWEKGVLKKRLNKEADKEKAGRLAELELQRKQKKSKDLKKEAAKLEWEHAIAVIIGNRDYKGSTPDVDFAGNDADAMKSYILNKLGYRPGNVLDLRDASQADLRAMFGTERRHRGRLYDYVRADDSDVIVFYSGHGVPDSAGKTGYLLPVDADPNRAELTGYPVDVLLKNLAKVPAKSMMVFIDACFSGDSPKGKLVRATSGLTVKITAPKKTSDNMIVITAAEGDQFASWDEDAKHGLFTKHLLEALNGAADKHAKTGNKDGKVTLGEVKAYLDREMTYQARRRFSRDQHATVSGDLKTVLSAY